MNCPNDRTRHPSASEVRWATVRLLLGLAEMMGAVASATFLLQLGVNEWSLGAVLFTCLCTTASVLLFGGRRSCPSATLDSQRQPENDRKSASR